MNNWIFSLIKTAENSSDPEVSALIQDNIKTIEDLFIGDKAVNLPLYEVWYIDNHPIDSHDDSEITVIPHHYEEIEKSGIRNIESLKTFGQSEIKVVNMLIDYAKHKGYEYVGDTTGDQSDLMVSKDNETWYVLSQMHSDGVSIDIYQIP